MALPGGYLLDTNILVHLVRRDALGRYLDATYGLSTGLNPFMLSVVTVGEMFALAGKFGWSPSRIDTLNDILGRFVWVDISDFGILSRYGEIDTASHAAGHKMGKNDIWIAATANVTQTTILTTDADFDHLHPTWIDLERVDPSSKLSGP